MIIKDLINYINENIADGCLTMDSPVYIKDRAEIIEADSLYNDCDKFTIGV